MLKDAKTGVTSSLQYKSQSLNVMKKKKKVQRLFTPTPSSMNSSFIGIYFQNIKKNGKLMGPTLKDRNELHKKVEVTLSSDISNAVLSEPFKEKELDVSKKLDSYFDQLSKNFCEKRKNLKHYGDLLIRMNKERKALFFGKYEDCEKNLFLKEISEEMKGNCEEIRDIDKKNQYVKMKRNEIGKFLSEKKLQISKKMKNFKGTIGLFKKYKKNGKKIQSKIVQFKGLLTSKNVSSNEKKIKSKIEEILKFYEKTLKIILSDIEKDKNCQYYDQFLDIKILSNNYFIPTLNLLRIFLEKIKDFNVGTPDKDKKNILKLIVNVKNIINSIINCQKNIKRLWKKVEICIAKREKISDSTFKSLLPILKQYSNQLAFIDQNREEFELLRYILYDSDIEVHENSIDCHEQIKTIEVFIIKEYEQNFVSNCEMLMGNMKNKIVKRITSKERINDEYEIDMKNDEMYKIICHFIEKIELIKNDNFVSFCKYVKDQFCNVKEAIRMYKNVKEPVPKGFNNKNNVNSVDYNVIEKKIGVIQKLREEVTVNFLSMNELDVKGNKGNVMNESEELLEKLENEVKGFIKRLNLLLNYLNSINKMEFIETVYRQEGIIELQKFYSIEIEKIMEKIKDIKEIIEMNQKYFVMKDDTISLPITSESDRMSFSNSVKKKKKKKKKIKIKDLLSPVTFFKKNMFSKSENNVESSLLKNKFISGNENMNFFDEFYYSAKDEIEMEDVQILYFGEVSLIDGTKNGKAKEFLLSSGALLFAGNYKHGVRNGFGKEYNAQTGKLIREGFWKHGLFTEVFFDSKTFNLKEDISITHSIKNKKKRLLSSGAAGNIFHVEGTIYAVKYVSFNRQDKDDFINECKLLSNLNHPNIVKFFSPLYPTHERILTLRVERKVERTPIGYVMEYCANGDVFNIIQKHIKKKKSINWNVKLRVLLETATGMKFLHDKNIIHYDLKWENVLINRIKQVKIIDFGTSKKLDLIFDSDKSLKHQKLTGTKNFIAPEITNRGRLSSMCDVFSFGIMTFCILVETNNPYNRNLGKDFEDEFCLYQKVAKDSSFRPSLKNFPKFKETNENKWIVDVMKKCWDHDPDRRLSFAQIEAIIFCNIPNQEL